jgi:hypothetical protein
LKKAAHPVMAKHSHFLFQYITECEIRPVAAQTLCNARIPAPPIGISRTIPLCALHKILYDRTALA